ncbi:hypothetical protein A9K55_008776 [Cordyceps militaris]|uniref:Uncharacterized protein n=1 Tax=Cordyceps militaris TaxID=73501 RepID=A0A2H4SI01_CORMI|nr:hypothetical protein A9K55_008776 [Cordyceps militaris]
MVVTDFKGDQSDSKAPRTVASSQSGHRQTVPCEAEDGSSHELHDLPPPYEAGSSSSQHRDRHDAVSDRSSSSTHRASASMLRVDQAGYQPPSKMTWDEKDASGYWARHDGSTGACCSARGGCCFSDRDACCFSDRDACCFSDRDACCFSDRGACCFSDHGACCFADHGACCFAGTAPGGRWRPVPSTGTLFKGLC